MADVAHQVRRALHRAAEGRVISVEEAASLLSARGVDLDHLCSVARQVREACTGRVVTYSRKVFVPLTRLCRDRCEYCTFATTPEAIPAPYLGPDEVLAIARAGRAAGCKEALLTLGDRPEARWPEARAWLAARGYSSTLEYLRAVSILVIEETGLLPHLNPGVMGWEEMMRLRPVAASMGLMLETSSERLSEPGEPHHGSPDKQPAARLRVIEEAGRLAIPFTTGILVGIGETHLERARSIFAIREIARRYGHVQEVIVQNFRAKPGTGMAAFSEPELDETLASIAVARIVLGPSAAVQAPPNLAGSEFPRLLDAGIDDWGGVSPVTADHVNPEVPWPQIEALRRATEERGLDLRERLCVHPRYVLAPDPWLHGTMRAPVLALATEDGLAREGCRPDPHPWQDLEVVPHSARSGPMPSADDAEAARGGPGHTLRADSRDVHGDWDALPVDVSRRWASRRPATDRDIAAALARAESGRPLDDPTALALFEASGDALESLCRIADAARRDAAGDVVTYVINRNINFTNVCYVGCRFCAFAQRRVDPDAFVLGLDEIARRAEEAWALGATEVCIQGGIHPDLPGDHYFEILRAIRRRVPEMHLHAFSPMEVASGAARLGISFGEWLTEAKAAGLGSLPGTAAEILDDEVRWVLTKGKLPADTWERIVRTAHSLGIPSSATIMYGHVDAPPHWVAHLRRVRRIQEETGGFTEFVPLPFVHLNAPIFLAGKSRRGPTVEENRRMYAIARLLLRGAIENIQVSWVKLGIPGAQVMLNGGCNDFGGTLMEETISRMAGASHGIRLEPVEIQAAIREIGRIPAERSTTYTNIRIVEPVTA